MVTLNLHLGGLYRSNAKAMDDTMKKPSFSMKHSFTKTNGQCLVVHWLVGFGFLFLRWKERKVNFEQNVHSIT